MFLIKLDAGMPSSSESSVHDNDEETEERLKRGCESFFAMKGAALVLPHSKDSQKPIKKHPVVGELQNHLQCIFSILRTEDTIKMAVRLESAVEGVIRYMVLASCMDTHQNTEETIILGVDIVNDQTYVGLVLPIWADSHISMDGDGGFTVATGERVNVFKPVSIQAMWSSLQALYKACDLARRYNYFQGGLHMTWIGYYQSQRASPLTSLKEWDFLPEIISTQREEISYFYQREGRYCPTDDELTRRFIFMKLREIMIHKDLENTTSKTLRLQLQEEIGKDLKEYRKFIDKQILLIVGQLDSATKIFDHIYLGSEWNASNLDELEENGVGYILNITKECDNFFPDLFQYCNIRLYDEEYSDLLKHWDTTYRFLSKAKEAGSRVLVHCKMGVSRSASTVIAYAMKEYEMSLETALHLVQEKRPVVRPNKAFMKQLQIYEGILEASRRHKIFRSKSDSLLTRSESVELLVQDGQPEFLGTEDIHHNIPRNKSWCERGTERTEQDSPPGAVGGKEPMFYIGADGHLAVQGLSSAAAAKNGNLESPIAGDKCSELTVPVPMVRPSSIVKLQKEGALAAGEVPFLVATEMMDSSEQSMQSSPGGNPNAVLVSEGDPSIDAETEEASNVEDVSLNTNNNRANELSLDGSEEGSAEPYQKVCVKTKITEMEKNALEAVEPAREEREMSEEGDGKGDAYEREAIPFNRGSVLRQKQELEGKLGGGGGSPTLPTVMKFEGEEGGVGFGGGEEKQPAIEQESSRPDEQVSSSDITQSTLAKTAETPDVPVDSQGQENTGDRDSVEIQQRESCNEGGDAECVPMETDDSESSLKKASVYTTSGEEIQMALGLVELHKRGFEQKQTGEQATPSDRKSIEMDIPRDEAMEVSAPSENAMKDSAASSGSPCDGVVSGGESECRNVEQQDEHQTAYAEEGSTWKVGDVQRHRMSLEEKIESASLPSSPTKRASSGSVQMEEMEESEDQGELTEEEVRRIQDLENITLTTPSPDVQAVGGEGMSGEDNKRQGIIAVAEQVRMLELLRCRSVESMSIERINGKGASREPIPGGTPPTSLEKPGTGSTYSPSEKVGQEALSSLHDDEPLVKLNQGIVKQFVNQISGSTKSVRLRSPRKSESDKDAGAAGPGGLRVRRQHGPSHPLHALGRGRAAGRMTASSKGKFYSTM